MMHHYAMTGCKRLKSSGDIDVEESYFFEDLTPHCDLDLEYRNPTFSDDTHSHDDAQVYQVSKLRVKWVREDIIRTNNIPRGSGPSL